jgi:hypothetical protein
MNPGLCTLHGQLVPQRQIFEHQGAAGSEHAEEAGEDEGMRVIMAVIIDRAGRNFNADETDGVSGRDRKRLSGLTLIGITIPPASTRGPGCSVPSGCRVYRPMFPWTCP